MNLQFYKPKNSILKKYIEGYYLIVEDKFDSSVRYFTFPNNFCIVTTSQNSHKTIIDGSIIVKPSATKNIGSSLVNRYISPISVELVKRVDEITVYFKPLGLNFFINDLESYFTTNFTSNFNPFDDFHLEMGTIFKTINREEQIELLENYWLSKLKNKDFNRIENILIDIENEISINNISKKYNISRQYINKLFLKHLGKTPSEYYKIHRFRKVVEKYRSTQNLTELAYQNLFYDQSHFIKVFKSITDNTPNSFFKKIDNKEKNIWLFI